MKHARRRREGKGGLELIEEATQLLRTGPAETLAVYYLGAAPFMLGLLYFWADMSRSPFASHHLAEAALIMTALFFWMKFCQSVFASRVRARIASLPMPRWSFRQCARVFMAQAIVQPSGLFVLPLAFITMLPFGWVYAFYQNVTALAEGEGQAGSKLVKKSWRQATLWVRQNHVLLCIAIGFAFFVFLNWLVVCLALPFLVKSLLGVESLFSRAPMAMVNTTFFMSMFVLTYLSVDPIVKAAYALRCFYGEALHTGEDLKAELKHAALAPQLAALGLILLTLVSAPVAKAAETTRTAPPANAPAAPTGVAPADLDRAINETIHERKYTWRMPRERVVDDAEEGVITRFLKKVLKLVQTVAKKIMDIVNWILDKLFRPRRTAGSHSSGYGWMMSLQILLYVLGAAIIIAVAMLLFRTWRRRHQLAPIASEAIQPLPDLTDENVGADQLPEDGWTRLARELLERGEFRLAMRAFYLGSLAHLAQRNLISLARFKSNRDYTLELRRRGHSFPDLLSDFGDNVSVFERIWYGMHDVNRDLVDRFAASVERIKTGG